MFGLDIEDTHLSTLYYRTKAKEGTSPFALAHPEHDHNDDIIEDRVFDFFAED